MPATDLSSDITEKSFKEQFASLGLIYWLAGWMELVERFAYYGVRVISPLFVVAAFEEGGLELTQIQKGQIWAVWAIVQSFVPILSGGFADRYGYKLNIAASTVFKIIGYLIMGYTVFFAEKLCGMPLAEARAQGVGHHTYAIFFVGAMFLAFGTAIFKPGLQGLISKTIPKDSAALGWGLFYQMVNIGAFIGPLLAGILRQWEWEYVFLACSIGISLNFIPLFFFKEPRHEYAEGENPPGPARLLLDALRGLLEPRLFFFTLAFCGFWLMVQQFFDILPNFIDDWVDSRAVASMLTGIFGSGVPTVHGGNLPQEWLLNLNALLISIFAFLVGYITGRFRSLTNIIIGIAFTITAIFCLTGSMSGWWILFCIGIFSIGEMMAAPTKMRYLARIAPPGKDGLYMGYANFTVGIGWSIGSIIAGHLYETGGDKVGLARRYLVEKMNLDSTDVAAVSKAELMPYFQQQLGIDAMQARQVLWETYEPYSLWLVFGFIGIGSMLALIIYNHFVSAADLNPNHSLNTHGEKWVKAFLIPICIILLTATYFYPSVGLSLNAAFFCMMAVIAFTGNRRSASKA